MFRVFWLRPAVDELAEIWVRGDSTFRQSATAASDAIDREFRDAPFRSSESRDAETRVLFVYPLGVQIEIDLDGRIVWVLHVWRFRRRSD